MTIWFIRCNGETAHNQPGTPRYVPGEEPTFPGREFNYRAECLQGGFARVGWPGAGDLRAPDWRSRAFNVYGSVMKRHHIRFLEEFVQIIPGDLVLLPTYQKRYETHLGVVIPPRRATITGGRFQTPYYYYFDIPSRNWYENAHRVDVEWAKRADGMAWSFTIPEIGGTWMRGFGEVKTGAQRIIGLARNSGLIP